MVGPPSDADPRSVATFKTLDAMDLVTIGAEPVNSQT
jgi:hypothetical protein